MSKEERPILEAKHVTKKFPLANGKELIANDDISLKFYKGQTLGIVGESGCGKSTFMRMMVQLEKPTSGKIFFKEKDITKMKGEELRANRRNVQMVFQNPATSFNPKMKVRDIICEPLMNFGLIKKKEKDAIARKYLEMVELPGDFVDRYPHNMSGGQQQRVGIARAIALEPEIIFCDESTSALDVSVQKTILELLVKLQKEKQIALGFICHDLAMISSIAHQVAVMYMGNIVEILPGEEVAERRAGAIGKVYLSRLQALDQIVWLDIDELDRCSLVEDTVGNALGYAHVRDGGDLVIEPFEVLDVHGGEHVDTCAQQLLDVLVALPMPATRGVRVGQFVHQHDLGMARQHGVQVELAQILLGSHTRLVQVAHLGLGQLALGDILEAQLHSGVAFLLGSLLLDDGAGTRLDNGDGDDLAVFVEDLRHTDFLANDCLHV